MSCKVLHLISSLDLLPLCSSSTDICNQSLVWTIAGFCMYTNAGHKAHSMHHGILAMDSSFLFESMDCLCAEICS